MLNGQRIKTIDEMKARALSVKKQIIAVASAEDAHVLEAVKDAIQQKFADFVLVGNEEYITEIAKKIAFDITNIPIFDEKIPINAAKKAVSLIRSKQADILMKGMVSSAELLKAVLDREAGLITGNTLSMAGVFELPAYHKLLILTDPAVNLVQDIKHKVQILKNGIEVCHVLGINRPKVAPLCAIEKINPAMQATVDADMLRKMYAKGEIQNIMIEGPLPMDVAISKDAATRKGIESNIAGDVDLLLTPNIESGNILYKTFVYLANGRNAGIVLGAKVPIILTSRSDSADAKLNSVALALLISDYQNVG